MSVLKMLCIVISIACVASGSESGFCEAPDECTDEDSRGCPAQSYFTGKRYILYDVNPAEGFNLRRDVYIRVAVFLRRLIERDKEYQWQLVLPPWGHLYHWQSRNIGSQERLSWGTFFDIASLQRYIPVVEMYTFMEEYSTCGSREVKLDRLYILQNDEEMFKTGKFEDKNELVDCDRGSLRYHELEQHLYTGPFWGYHNVTVQDVKCLKFHGTARDLSQNLMPTQYRSIMFDRMEIALHDEYGSKEYWRARRGMRYNSELYDIAEKYRKTFLNSTNVNDNTERPADWTKEKNRRNARGGPYLAVHLRRRDFIRAHEASVPTIMNTALQLQKRMDRLLLTLLFVATDAEQYEFEELESYLPQYKVMKYVPSDYVINKFKDGGVAIIDQIICSYASGSCQCCIFSNSKRAISPKGETHRRTIERLEKGRVAGRSSFRRPGRTRKCFRCSIRKYWTMTKDRHRSNNKKISREEVGSFLLTFTGLLGGSLPLDGPRELFPRRGEVKLSDVFRSPTVPNSSPSTCELVGPRNW